MAIQKLSVKLQFKNKCPRHRTDQTCEFGTAPINSTQSWSWCRSTISSSASRLGPSPPIIKSTWGNDWQMAGRNGTKKWIHFRYPIGTRQQFELCGSNLARKNKFSRRVYDTAMHASTVDKVADWTWFKTTEARSFNPKREWSVFALANPKVDA